MASGEVIATIKLCTGSCGPAAPGDLIEHLEKRMRKELRDGWWHLWGVVDIKLDYESWEKK